MKNKGKVPKLENLLLQAGLSVARFASAQKKGRIMATSGDFPLDEGRGPNETPSPAVSRQVPALQRYPQMSYCFPRPSREVPAMRKAIPGHADCSDPSASSG